MTKLWKRLGALMMTLAMVLSLGVGAFALTVTNPTITFNGVASGDVVTAYRLVKYTDSNYNSYTFDTSFGNFVDIKSSSSDRESYLNGLDNAGIGALLDEYAKEVLKTGGTYTLPTDSSEKVSATAAGTSVNLTLEPGYYIVLTKTTSGNSLIYTPVAVFVQVKNDAVKVYGGPEGTDITTSLQVAMKSVTAPSIEKNVKDADWQTTNKAAVGEIVAFRVNVSIPAYTNPVTDMTLVLTDTLTNLEYKDGSVKVCSDADCATPIGSGVAVDSTNTTSYDSATGKQTLVLNLDYNMIKSGSGATTVYVYYEATVQKEALTNGTGKATIDAGNSVTLTYKNAADPSDPKTTGASKTNTYNFALKVQKQDKDGNSLTGASFTVYDAATGGTAYSFLKNGDYYYPVTAGTSGADTVIPVADDGTILIKGLDADNYYFEETTVPSGYYEPNGRFKVNLVAKVDAGKYTGDLDASSSVGDDNNPSLISGAVNGTNADQYDITIKNSDIPTLPSTGGMGTMLFTVLGVVLMALAAGLFFFRRRKNA